MLRSRQYSWLGRRPVSRVRPHRRKVHMHVQLSQFTVHMQGLHNDLARARGRTTRGARAALMAERWSRSWRVASRATRGTPSARRTRRAGAPSRAFCAARSYGASASRMCMRGRGKRRRILQPPRCTCGAWRARRDAQQRLLMTFDLASGWCVSHNHRGRKFPRLTRSLSVRGRGRGTPELANSGKEPRQLGRACAA